VTTAGRAGDLPERVIDRLVEVLPGLVVRAAQDVLAAAQADHGRALREFGRAPARAARCARQRATDAQATPRA
jgi:hypothetical protein